VEVEVLPDDGEYGFFDGEALIDEAWKMVMFREDR
jgi:hypothetical protein